MWSASFYDMFISYFGFATGDLEKWLTVTEVEMRKYSIYYFIFGLFLIFIRIRVVPTFYIDDGCQSKNFNVSESLISRTPYEVRYNI